MASSGEKRDGPEGNGHSFLEILRAIVHPMATALLPFLAARAAEYFASKLEPKKPKVELPLQPPVPVAIAPADAPPPLPKLTELPDARRS